MIVTPVGVRCRKCAQMRRLPQFDVGPLLLLRAGLGGLLVSLGAWYVISFTIFLRYFLSILVGLAVGEVVSRLARRRVSRALEVVAVLDVIFALAIVELARSPDTLSALGRDQSVLIALLIPAAIASYVAVIKLR